MIYPYSNKLNRKVKIKHFLIWFSIILHGFLFNQDPNGTILTNGICILLNHGKSILIYYILCLFVFPRYRENITYIILYLLLLFIVYLSIAYLSKYIVSPALKINPFRGYIPTLKFVLANFVLFFIVAICALSFFFNRYSIYKSGEIHEREKLLLQRELSILQNHYNDHVFFNFLNYCYSQINKHSLKVADTIELYSELLRFTINIKPDEKVDVYEEVQHLQNYIKLKKQLNPKLSTEFHVKGELKNKKLISRILITFIENAFKHGVSTDPQNPIKINLSVNEDILTFSVWNKINHNKKVISTGTGLENVKQTLNLNYTDNYELRIETYTDNYYIELTLNLVHSASNLKQLTA